MARLKPTAKQKKPTTPSRPKPEQIDTSSSSKEPGDSIPVALQQKCLDIFRDAFTPGLDDGHEVILQQVKTHLYNRDFAAAFGQDEYLRVYASRWSPGRALAYLRVFGEVGTFLSHAPSSTAEERGRTLRVTCLGGGAGGEVVALAAWWSLGHDALHGSYDNVHVTMVDMADWSNVVTTLANGILTAPALSQFASQAKKDANKPLLSLDVFATTFKQLDVLNPTAVEDLSSTFAETRLLTFMFTLNELYSTSLARTQALLALLTANMTPGSCVLVVDSPGSYSSVAINGAERKYPMHWLLDHTLLGGRRDAQGEAEPDAWTRQWEKVLEEESRWFRLPVAGLRYPIALEDMRVQIHMYRRMEG